MSKTTAAQSKTPEATTPVKADATSGVTAVSKDAANATISAGTVGSKSTTKAEAKAVDLDPGLPRVKVHYPKDYEGDKFYRDGDVYPVSQEVADQLVNAKIATIVK